MITVRPESIILPLAACVLAISIGACGSDESADAATDAAIQEYRASLVEGAGVLVEKVKLLVAPIRSEKVERAQSFYATARVPYGQIEQVAQTFEPLDKRINARADEIPPDELGGFHRIEKALWVERNTASVVSTARQLLADVETLESRVKKAELTEEQIFDGAVELLDEITAVKLAGKEERYAEMDFVDVGANLEGAEAAFLALKPILAEEDPSLLASIEAGFRRAFAELRSFGLAAREPEQSHPNAPGASFAPDYERTPAEIRKLAATIEVLARRVSKAAGSLE